MNKICIVTTIHRTINSFCLKSAQYLHNNGGYDITFICNPDKDFENNLPPYIHFIPVKMKRGISLGGIKAVFEMRRIFKEQKFDIVQYSTPNAAFYASIAATLAHIKIRNYHLMGLRYLGASGIGRIILKMLEKISCTLSTHIECVSQSNLKLAVNDGLFNKEKAVVIWHGSTGGVDLQRFDAKKREQYKSEIRHMLQIDNEDFVFGFVGRITRDKGINEILAAFLGIEQKCKLMIIGAKEGVSTLNQDLWNKALKNENIIIVDSVSDIEKYYSAIDMLLLPSYREGFGMVIAEAAAMGTSAIVSNVPGPIDVVEAGKTAFLVNAKDADDLQSKMKYALLNKCKVLEMGKNCVTYVQEHFDSEVLNEYILERKNYLMSDKESNNE